MISLLNRKVELSVVAFAIFAVTGVRAQNLDPVDPTLHALLIFDTDSSLKPFLSGNKAILTKVLEQGFDRRMNNYRPKIFESTDVISDKVVAYILGLKNQVKPIDTVFVYYAGHGATLEGKGHYFTMYHDWSSNRPGLGRIELLHELQKLNVRHVVVISDCCSETIGGVIGKESALPKASWPVLDCLFFHHRGVTDINACQKNAFSWYYNNSEEAGGAFTLTLSPLLCTKKDNFGKIFGTEDGFVSWQQFAKPLQAGTNDRYVRMRADFLKVPLARLSEEERDTQKKAQGQSKQDPELISLPKKAIQNVRERKWLFGAQLGTAKLQSGKTFAVIGKVYPKTVTGDDTPAAKADVRSDDLVMEVNGVATLNDLDAAREIDHSEQKMTLRIRRGNNKPVEINVDLLPVKKPS